jgi:tungstate transport system substrate-binding protein
VNPARYRDTNYRGAMRLIGWLTSVEGQKIIADFKINDQPLFIPTAVPPAAP